MDVSETKQENSETCIHQMIWDCIALIQRNIRDTHIYDFAMLKREFPSKTANALLFNSLSILSFQIPHFRFTEKILSIITALLYPKQSNSQKYFNFLIINYA